MTANCLRVLEQDLEVGGHLVPGGTVAVLCHMTMAHNPEVLLCRVKLLCWNAVTCKWNSGNISSVQFINNPDVFLPERWMKSEKEYVSSQKKRGQTNYSRGFCIFLSTVQAA